MQLHISLQSKGYQVIKCLGVTKDPNTGDYMLVMPEYQIDLRSFVKQNYSTLKWKDVYYIFWYILGRIYNLHQDNIVHKDLHSGNVLQDWNYTWDIADFGLCGPADKPPTKIYGNMPYMAPEVIRGGVYTTAADIYSIGMLMYEVAVGHSPFLGRHPDIHLAFKICHGIRPTLPEGIPESYKNMMIRCWDADLSKRPTVGELYGYFYFQCKAQDNSDSALSLVNSSKRKDCDTMLISSTTSSLFSFDGLPEPRNATQGIKFLFVHMIKIVYYLLI